MADKLVRIGGQHTKWIRDDEPIRHFQNGRPIYDQFVCKSRARPPFTKSSIGILSQRRLFFNFFIFFFIYLFSHPFNKINETCMHTETTTPALAHIHALTIQCHFSRPSSLSPLPEVYFWFLCACVHGVPPCFFFSCFSIADLFFISLSLFSFFLLSFFLLSSFVSASLMISSFWIH